MFKWIQGGISAVTGLAEPEYGESHFHSSTKRLTSKKVNPYTRAVVSAGDFDFQNPSNTNVETATFYINDLETGYCGFAQIIHSNIGISTNAQFTFKLYNSNKELGFKQIWTSTKLENFEIVDKKNFKADNLTLQWNEDGSLRIKSDVNPESIVDLLFKPSTPNGVKFGTDPNTYYGPSIEEQWGSMRHVYHPRCQVEGTVTNLSTGDVIEMTNEKTFGLYVMALQNMKPHHCAKEWRFAWFVNETESLVLMQFETPKSYGNSIVSQAIVTIDDDNETKIIACPCENDLKLLGQYKDEETGWSYAKSIEYTFNGYEIKDNSVDNEQITEDSKAITFELKGELSELIERMDVMNEIPQFVKNIVSGVTATKPFIYQYFSKDLTLSRSDVPESAFKGSAWVEVTYITDEREAAE